jgi:type I restriction enzyme S subunit
MSEWKKCALDEIAYIIPGYAFKSKHFGNEGMPVIKITDITPPYINVRDAMRVDLSHYDVGKLSKYKIKKNGFVIAMTGATIGKIGRLTIDTIAIVNQRVAKILPKESVVREFVYYCIQGDDFQGFIQNNVDSHSAQENISGTSIGRYPILLPSQPEQKAIASVLSSLDDKIDLLHRQNKTLEAMAETLFRQWFVEEAQEDWEENSLLEIIQLIGGGTPKTAISEYWNGDIPWLAGGDIASNHKSFINYSVKSITEVGLNNSSAKLLPKYATVISARGTVGKYCLLAQSMAFSQSNYGILPNPKISECFFFTYLLVNHMVEELQSSAYGSVFDTITTTTFKEIKVILPTETEILRFEQSVSLYFKKMFLNKSQIRTLEKLRDTLLLKLMNGEVRVEYEN